MRVPDSSRRSPVGANMTPMIDVVFLLIIFFLVSSHLARQENRHPVDLPSAMTFLPLDFERTPLTVTVDEQAKVRLSGRVASHQQLQQSLLELYSESGPEASVRIRSDGRVPYRVVEPILREAGTIGITDVIIAVREEQQK